MVFCFDSDLNIVDVKKFISFSYNKKANREGNGKVELINIPNPLTIYISIYNDDEYITSGIIKEIQKDDKKVAITFNTLESILKNHKIPNINNFEKLTPQKVIINLLYSFLPIIKSKKKDFSYFNNGYGINANSLKGVLHAENITYGKVKDGDLHLSFNKEKEELNEYRYCENGFIIFNFDLGERNYIQKQFYKDEGKLWNDYKEFPYAFLRFTCAQGNKTYIRVKIIGKDRPILNYADVKRDFEVGSYIEIDRSIKDYEKNTGIKWINKHRYIAIGFYFFYDMVDWISDYSTAEVYNKDGQLEKRTVRGFTPVLNGFEILNRLSIKPFNSSTETNIIFKGDVFNEVLNYADIKLNNITLYDALIKVAEKIKDCCISFDLKPSDNKGQCILSFFADKKNNEKKIILRNHEIAKLNNYKLKTITQKCEKLYCLHYYGEGEGQDVLYCCIFNQYEKVGEETQEKLYIYSAYAFENVENGIKIPTQENGTYEQKIIKNISQCSVFPQHLSFTEETTRNSDIKDLYILIIKAIEYFKELQKKDEYNFEIESTQNVRLYDDVLLLHQKSNLQLKTQILEEKINIKNNKLTKTLGIGGFLFNPFNSLFKKPLIIEATKTPQKPFNVKAYIQNGCLSLAWDCYSEVDNFIVAIERLDGEPYFHNIGMEATAFFHTSINELKISAIDKNILYSVCITSYLEGKKSDSSSRLYFRITQDMSLIRILSSLTEIGSKEGEKGFFLDINYRNSKEAREYIKSILPYTDIKSLNCEDDIENWNLKTEEEAEAIRRFLGLGYIWEGGKWIDRRIKLPKKPPIIYIDFKTTPKDYNSSVFNLLVRFFDRLKLFESYRQELEYLTKFYRLPTNGTVETFSLNENQTTQEEKQRGKQLNKHKGKQKAKKRIIRQPINPPISPLPPPSPIVPIGPIEPIKPLPPSTQNPIDNRKEPTIKEILRYNELKEYYDKIKKELEGLLSELISMYSNYFNDFQQKKGLLFDISLNDNNLSFNVPIFEILKDEWQQKKADILNNKGSLYLGNAWHVYWQSTLKDGYVCWPYNKPQFYINKINKSENIINGYTLSFYLKVIDVAGEVELWNYNNESVGYCKDGFLYFACKLQNAKTQENNYKVFYKYPLNNLKNENGGMTGMITEPQYIHILIMGKESEIINNWSGKTEKYITQNIYINFNEIVEEEYEEKRKYIGFFVEEKNIASCNNNISFFNFRETYKKDEQKDKPTTALPRFNVCFSNILFFDYWLSYGERQFIKNKGSYPISEEVDEDGKKKSPSFDFNGNAKGNSAEGSKYKGVCVSVVNGREVEIYKVGKKILEIGEYFLMANKYEQFESGVLYLWNGDAWKALLPYSCYHREYIQAYSDIITQHENIPNLFFKDFITNIVLFTKEVYSQNIIVNNLTIQKDFVLNGLQPKDPHVKGAIYVKNGTLKVSNGKK